jgi:hypothetical protein
VQIEPQVWPASEMPTLADVDFTSAEAPATTGIEGVDVAELAAFLALIRR